MTVYVFDGTMEGLLSSVFDAFFLKEEPEQLLTGGDVLPLFCDRVYQVTTDNEKARRVWTGLEKKLSREAMRMITTSLLSELQELWQPLFMLINKVFRQGSEVVRNFADPDVLTVTQIARRVAHEAHRMMQFVRFQKAIDGTYLSVISPDHDVLPLIINHFHDRFNDQPWLIYDAHRHYGYHYDGNEQPIRISFENESSVPFSLIDGKLSDDILSDDDHLLQDLWRTYFKAICIRERLNPRKQLNDMPRRYWKYLTEKQQPNKTNT